jgi:hypothetical protein
MPETHAFLVDHSNQHVMYAVDSTGEKEARAVIEKYLEGFPGTVRYSWLLDTTKLKLNDGECRQIWPTKDI